MQKVLKDGYESPKMELVFTHVEGMLCLSMNQIGNVEFEYDEDIKE